MKFLKVLFYLTLSFSFVENTFSQYYITGEDPASIEWREIESRYFKIVYDSEFGENAQKVASYLDHGIELAGDYHYMFSRKLPVIIHNHNMQSNGMVAWAPRRMELFTVPPQDMYAHGWFEQLALHEGRHVAQMYRLHQGVTNVFTYIFGEQGAAISIAQTHPWFLEGDAVVTETALTKSGRGRMPSFQMGYRSILLEKNKNYSFRKAVFGSYKNYVPNHYELGYLMVAYNRAKYSPELWSSTVNRIGKRGLFATNPFRKGVKKYTGLNRTKLYKNTLDYYENFWQDQADSLTYTSFTTINTRKSKSYTSYTSPVSEGAEIYAIKSGMDDVTKIVAVDLNTGEEKCIHIPGTILSERIQIKNGVLYWDELKPDLRWPQRSFSEIKALELSTGKLKTITRKTRYSAPAISGDGSKIAVVESNIAGEISLLILSSTDGRVIGRISIPGNAAVQLPSWDANSDKIVMTRVDEKGKSLVEYNLVSKNWRELKGPSGTNISSPVYHGKHIYFVSSFSGIDNIYAIDTSSLESFQVTSVKNGAFYPYFLANTDTMLFNNYTSEGHRLAFLGVNPEKYTSIQKISPLYDPVVEKITSQEPKKFDYNKLENVKYESKPYNKFAHLVNVHSWFPFYAYENPEGPTRSISMLGATFLSQNLQNTLIAKGGAGAALGRMFSNVELVYRGFFPVFNIRMFYGDSINYINKKDAIASTAKLFQFDGSMSLPFNFSEGNFVRSLTPAIALRHDNRFYYSRVDGSQSKQGFERIAYSAQVQIYKMRSLRDLSTRFGISAFVYYQSPIANKMFAPSNMLITDFYLPGVFKHHSIILSYQYENHFYNKLGNQYFLSQSLIGPLRGFDGRIDKELSAIKKMSVFGANYLMPLLYPDITFLKVIYIKRLKSTLFYEHAFAELFRNNGFYKKEYNSKGIEITADMNVFFFPVDIYMGARISRVNIDDKIGAEFLFGINL